MKTFNITIGKGKGALKLDAQTLLGTRCLVQGKSGSGKSHLARVIVEQTIEHGLQTIIFDPSGEFKTLRERCDLLIAGNENEGADVPLEIRSAKQLLRRVAETGISCVLDLSDLSKKDRREFVRIALDTLHNLPRKHWAPRVIVVDECQEYAPESGKGKSTSLESVIETANQGRKRGHCLIAVTLRLSALSKDVTAELQNKFIGNTDHIDLKRAQDALGSTAEQREQLRKLKPGTYFATGPALSDPDLVLFEGRASTTTHPKPGTQQRLTTPPPSRAVKAKILKEFEALPPSVEAETAQTLAQAQAEVKRLTKALAKAEGAQGPAPAWAEVESLQRRLEKAEAAADKALAVGEARERKRLGRALRSLPGMLRQTATHPLKDMPIVLERLENMAGAVEEILKEPTSVGDLSLKQEITRGRTSSSRPSPQSVPRSAKLPVTKPKKTYVESAGDTFTLHHAPELPFSWSSAPGKLLTVLIQWEESLSGRRVAALAGVNYKSSTFRNALTKLRSVDGLIIQNGNSFEATDRTRATYGPLVEPLPSGDDLIAGWRSKLGGVPLAIFDTLVARGGRGSREAVCEAAGTDPNLSTSRNAFTKLRNLGLLESGRGDLQLAEHVMEAMD